MKKLQAYQVLMDRAHGKSVSDEDVKKAGKSITKLLKIEKAKKRYISQLSKKVGFNHG